MNKKNYVIYVIYLEIWTFFQFWLDGLPLLAEPVILVSNCGNFFQSKNEPSPSQEKLWFESSNGSIYFYFYIYYLKHIIVFLFASFNKIIVRKDIIFHTAWWKF